MRYPALPHSSTPSNPALTVRAAASAKSNNLLDLLVGHFLGFLRSSQAADIRGRSDGFCASSTPPDGRKRRRAAVEEKFFRLPGAIRWSKPGKKVSSQICVMPAWLRRVGVRSGCPSNHQSNAAAEPCLVTRYGVFG